MTEGTQWLDQQRLVATSPEKLEKDGGVGAAFDGVGSVAVSWSPIGAGWQRRWLGEGGGLERLFGRRRRRGRPKGLVAEVFILGNRVRVFVLVLNRKERVEVISAISSVLING